MDVKVELVHSSGGEGDIDEITGRGGHIKCDLEEAGKRGVGGERGGG